MSFLEEMEAMHRREEAFRLLLLECLAEMEAEAGRLSVEADAPGVPRIAAPLTASPDCHIGVVSMPQADALEAEADGPLIVEPPEVPR